jgi:hypothetical protein
MRGWSGEERWGEWRGEREQSRHQDVKRRKISGSKINQF